MWSAETSASAGLSAESRVAVRLRCVAIERLLHSDRQNCRYRRVILVATLRFVPSNFETSRDFLHG